MDGNAGLKTISHANLNVIAQFDDTDLEMT